MSQELIDAITDMREEEALAIAKQQLDSGVDPLKILADCREAMDQVGQRFEENKYFISELMLAGEMINEISDMVKPALAGTESGDEKLGTVLIGTVLGDIHDIGKDIVTFMLEINGFEVVDLGVDVPPAKFVEAAKETQPDVIGLSGFLTLSYDPMKETVQLLREAGFTSKVMIGGGNINEDILKYTNADAFGRDAMVAVSLAKDWVA